jgi:cytochrome c oxidase subunit 1
MILGVGFLLMLVYLLHSLFAGKKAPANPWGGLSMEWETPSPPPTHNFTYDPVLKHGPYDFDKVVPVTEDSTDESEA